MARGVGLEQHNLMMLVPLGAAYIPPRLFPQRAHTIYLTVTDPLPLPFPT